jgi:hypothetical protein
MTSKRNTALNKAAGYTLISAGVILLLVSVFYVSSFVSILSLGLLFWGVIILYISPLPQAPLALLNAAASPNTNNIERILTETQLTQKGRYLPPKNLKALNTSLIFVPKTPQFVLPTPEENTDQLFSTANGIFLSPPGLALSQLLEAELGRSFTEIELETLPNLLPKLLVDNLAAAKSVEIAFERPKVTVEIRESILGNICDQVALQTRTHEQVGCLLSSALACVLAKVTGSAVVIERELHNPRSLVVEYLVE